MENIGRFVVYKRTMGHASVRVLNFSPITFIPQTPRTHSSIIGAILPPQLTVY